MADQNSTTVQNVAPTALDGVPADYQRTVDVKRHTSEHVHGNKTAFEMESHTDDESGGVIDNRLMTVIDGRIEARQKAEDLRANARNRNRIYILVVVLIMELAVPTLYGMHMLPALFLKYEVLAITAPDALLTVWAYIHKY
jgi:hypothetical protein